MNTEDLRQQYGEAVRLYLWYSESEFSWHKGKTSKELARKHQRIALDLMSEIMKQKR